MSISPRSDLLVAVAFEDVPQHSPHARRQIRRLGFVEPGEDLADMRHQLGVQVSDEPPFCASPHFEELLRACSFYLLTPPRPVVECERAHKMRGEGAGMRVTAETKTATRQRILDAAQKLFAEQGFEAATTRDIARRAEIAVGTLFNYFPTKEAVALHLVCEATAQAAEQFETVLCRESALPLAMEEALFAHVAAVLRKLKPFRKHMTLLLNTVLSPLADDQVNGTSSFRAAHLEIVS